MTSSLALATQTNTHRAGASPGRPHFQTVARRLGCHVEGLWRCLAGTSTMSPLPTAHAHAHPSMPCYAHAHAHAHCWAGELTLTAALVLVRAADSCRGSRLSVCLSVCLSPLPLPSRLCGGGCSTRVGCCCWERGAASRRERACGCQRPPRALGRRVEPARQTESEDEGAARGRRSSAEPASALAHSHPPASLLRSLLYLPSRQAPNLTRSKPLPALFVSALVCCPWRASPPSHPAPRYCPRSRASLIRYLSPGLRCRRTRTRTHRRPSPYPYVRTHPSAQSHTPPSVMLQLQLPSPAARQARQARQALRRARRQCCIDGRGHGHGCGHRRRSTTTTTTPTAARLPAPTWAGSHSGGVLRIAALGSCPFLTQIFCAK